MTKLFKSLAGTALALALVSPVSAQNKPAPAQPASVGTTVQGVGVADLQAAVASSNAYRTAQQQRATYFKPTVDAAQARAQQIDAQLKTLIDKFNADRAAKKPEAQLQQQAQQIQKLRAEGEAEINRALAPVQLSDEFVVEQISEKLPQAVQNVIAKRNLSLLLSPDGVIFAGPQYDVTAAIVAELNVLVPTVQIVPPQGWVPARMRQQQQGAAPAAAAPAARPAGPQPEGR
ncbi:MAG TPA: OmpH family outer membrane protein [Novosphingobium sp.]|nr:OmpH family outer membrane protein [Novosphingobium sp.]